ncbi:hypothetical protein BD769DRAFT_1670198 [Suillus cothurnatus]|nr:hypothetical protein BD769DRAFT_1670198 [Suillus cothurnatus]
MSAAAMDLIEIFDGEGAFIFVDRPVGGMPIFHVQTSSALRAGEPQVAGRADCGVMLATEELRQYPAQLNSMIQTIANDITVSAAFSDTVEMAQYLATEARKVTYAPYVSAAGQIMKDLGRHAG